MKQGQFNAEHVIGICKMYNRHCGPGMLVDRIIENRHDRAGSMAGDIRNMKSHKEYAVGSRWSLRSKLRFSLGPDGDVIPSFYPSLDPHEIGGIRKEAEEAGKKFKKESLEYLAKF